MPTLFSLSLSLSLLSFLVKLAIIFFFDLVCIRPFANHHAIMPRFWAFFIFFSIMPPSCHGGWWGRAFALHHLGISPQMA